MRNGFGGVKTTVREVSQEIDIEVHTSNDKVLN